MSIPFFEKKFGCAADPPPMFGQCPKFGSFFFDGSPKLDKLYELDQVSYDSYVRLVKVYDILLKMGTDCFI